MNSSSFTRIFTAVSVCLFIIFSAGCQEQTTASGPAARKHQLIANQNLQLKGELKECRSEIENLNKELTACTKDRDYFKTEAEEEMGKKMIEVLSSVVEENQQLKEQIKEMSK